MTYLETMLGSVDTFKGLSPAEIREIARIGNDVEFAAGSTFVEEGLQGADFYLILEGQARLQVPKKEPRTIGPGESLGEISVLDGGPRTATVTAEMRVLAFRIGRDQFLPLLDRHGSIGRKILVRMCGRLRYAESRMSEEPAGGT